LKIEARADERESTLVKRSKIFSQATTDRTVRQRRPAAAGAEKEAVMQCAFSVCEDRFSLCPLVTIDAQLLRPDAIRDLPTNVEIFTDLLFGLAIFYWRRPNAMQKLPTREAPRFVP
jgi:hypothetical protein